MNEEELFKLELSEAKDHLIHIDASIDKTRTRVFYLIGISFTLLGFLSEDLYSGQFYSVKSVMFYPALFVTFLILWKCRGAITPTKQRMNGITPMSFERNIINSDTPKKVILNTYQKSIEINADVLFKLSDSYKIGFIALIILGVLLPFICVIASLISQSLIT